MFRIESIEYLYLVIFIPIIWLSYRYYLRQNSQNWSKLGVQDVLWKYKLGKEKLLPNKLIINLIALVFLIVALCNPQFGSKKENIKTQSLDIFIALDVSKSMLVNDIRPNRLSRAQLWIKQFTERFKSERIGFISFAGNAYLQSPLTSDIPTIQLMASMSSPSTIGTQGTSLAAPISLARKSFPKQDGYHKVLLLISDGEDHEGEAIDEAKLASGEGISIITIPVGTESGGYVPDMEATQNAYKKDIQGQFVVSVPNRKLLTEISANSNGQMMELTNGEDIFNQLKKRFALITKRDATFQSFSEYESYFSYFIIFAGILLVADFFLRRKKNVV
ncbi:MAG: VWA domain-containing protein [Bacteroidota bacterium]|nr:VWA domain-containing protein [Bacteroidota bacterium]